MKIKLILAIVLLISQVGLNDLVNAQKLDNYYCTWIGNSFAGGYTEQKWVQHSLHDAVVTPDGKVITATLGEEGRRRCSIYKNGRIWDNGNDRTNGTLKGVIGGAMCSGGNCFSSKTVAYHPDQSWIYGTHSDDVSIRRWYYHGLIDDNFKYNLGGRAEGLAANEQILVASFNNEITILNIDDASEIRKFSLPSPTRITLDHNGDIWVVCKNETEVREYSQEGYLLNTLNEYGWGPEDVSMDNTGRLIVSDNGPDQQVKFYDISGDEPVLDFTLGQKGGITSGTPGIVTHAKLWDLKACGTDSAGNIYVVMATHNFYPTIRSYTPDGKTIRWEIHGLEFCTVADYDTETEKFHSYYNTYTFDYTSPPDGTQWKLHSHNINPIAYPNDMRITHHLGFSTQFRRINGKHFLFLTDMGAHNLHIYRFEEEIAVPSVAFSTTAESWALNSPDGNWIWTDKNGNGDFEAGEYSTGSDMKSWSWWVDIENTIWNAYKKDIYAYPCQGLDTQGNPVYSFHKRNKYEVPEPFNFISKARYNPVTDVMILSGFTPEHPKSEVKYGSNKGSGLVFARYDNWSKTPEKKWVQVLEYELTYNSWENQLWPRSFDVAGDYMFVVWGSYGPSGKNKASQVLWSRGEVTVYDLATGEKVGYMLPDSTIGGPPPAPSRPTISGAQDMSYSVHAHQRDNGEYIIITEENKWSKNVIYRWCQSGDCMESSMKIRLNSPPNDTLLFTYNGITLEPDIIADTCKIEKVEYYANNSLIGTSEDVPYSFTLSDTSLEKTIFQAKLISASGAYKFSEKRYLTISNGTPVVTLNTPLQDSEHNITDTVEILVDAFDYDGSVDSVEFYANDIKIGSDNASPFSHDWVIREASDYQLYAVAKDDSGKAGTSQPLDLTAYGYRQADNPVNVRSGLIYEYFEGEWENLPDFPNLSALHKDTIPHFETDSIGRINNFAYRFTGYIQITEKGRYSFYTYSNDGNRLFIGDRLVVDNDGIHGAREKKGDILLEEGLHRIEVRMFVAMGVDNFIVSYSGPGNEKKEIPGNVLFRATGTAPVISIVSPQKGEIYNQGDTVWLSAFVTDPDNDVNKVEFYAGNKMLGNIADTGTSLPVANLQAGIQEITARAYDLCGSVSVSETILITINARPQIYFYSPEDLSQFRSLDTIYAEVVVTDDNPREVRFYVNNNHIKTLTYSPWRLELSNLNKGTYFIRAEVIDENNLKALAKIEIRVLNTPPTISIIQPDSGAVYESGEAIKFKAHVSDPDNDVYKVAFYENNTQMGDDANIFYTTTVRNLEDGIHTIRAKAFDKAGAVSESEPVTFVVGFANRIQNVNGNESLKVYPNPLSNGDLMILFEDLNKKASNLEIQIWDITGVIVYMEEFTGPGFTINISSDIFKEKGLYIIQIKSSKGVVNYKLMVH